MMTDKEVFVGEEVKESRCIKDSRSPPFVRLSLAEVPQAASSP